MIVGNILPQLKDLFSKLMGLDKVDKINGYATYGEYNSKKVLFVDAENLILNLLPTRPVKMERSSWFTKSLDPNDCANWHVDFGEKPEFNHILIAAYPAQTFVSKKCKDSERYKWGDCLSQKDNPYGFKVAAHGSVQLMHINTVHKSNPEDVLKPHLVVRCWVKL